MKTGVLGGTFDPVHRGHIALAGAARVELGLDGVVFIPAGQPVFKTDRPVTPAEHRLAMLRLGLNDIRKLYISDIDWLRKATII